MRALALTMKDQEVTILINDLAANYDKLADNAVFREQISSGQSKQRAEQAASERTAVELPRHTRERLVAVSAVKSPRSR